MVAEQLGNGLLQDSHAVAVDYANPRGGGHYSAIQKLVHRVARFFGVLADHVDFLVHGSKFRRRTVADVLWQLTAWLAGIRQHLDHVIGRDLHLHETRLDLNTLSAQNAPNAGGIPHVFEPYAHAFLNSERLNFAAPRVLVGGEDGSLEILAQFALGFGDAALRVLRGFALVGALPDLPNRLLRLFTMRAL
jgi:hypothetical protein